MKFDIHTITRENVKTLKPYSSARDEFTGDASVYLDANENSLGSPLTKWYNRYPDPLQRQLKEKIGSIKGIDPDGIFLGNGSDECIDILIRAFCEPGVDNMLICPPTYGMYEVSAAINNVAVKKVPLTNSFQLDLPAIENAVDDHTKMIFLCSPNNPTGNAIHREDVEAVLNNYFGIVVIDEAYVNFSRFRSFSQELKDYPQLVIMQTLSKAWGLAALRVGMSFASREIIGVMNRIKPPYNINQASQELAMTALDNVESVNEMIRELIAQRKLMEEELPTVPVIKKLFPSEANFILAEVSNAPAVYHYLLETGIVVRLRKNILIFGDCLRITVGTPEENTRLIEALKNFKE